VATDLIHDRGRGPELVGTRITVYNLLPYFLDAESTEDDICRSYGLTPEQVAAARAWVLNHPATLAKHFEIEAQIAVGNPPEVAEQAQRAHAAMMNFKEWLARRDEAMAQRPPGPSASFPTFEEWVANRQSQPTGEQ